MSNENFTTLETIVGDPAKKERLESEGVKQKSAVLIAQLSWCAHVWNATPQAAAHRVVADLYTHLSGGGTVQVNVEQLDGTVSTVEVTAIGE